MLNLVLPFSNIEMELAETLYIITMPTKKTEFKERNTQYLIKIQTKSDKDINYSN
ncbi:hypothetical protein L2E81_07615 [Planktothrix agardhii 1033]|nr:hypothetical protein [Planktothrix agardhii 1033]